MKKLATLAFILVALAASTGVGADKQGQERTAPAARDKAQQPLPPKAEKSAAATCSFTIPSTGMPTMPYWKRGTAVTIKWTITGFPGQVKLFLIDYCAWAVNSSIVASTPNTGTYTWNIPNTLPCGIYEVYVQNASGPAVNWCYSANFAITK